MPFFLKKNTETDYQCLIRFSSTECAKYMVTQPLHVRRNHKHHRRLVGRIRDRTYETRRDCELIT